MVFFCAKQYDNDVSDAHLDCPAYRTRLKPKIDIVLVKTPEFGDIIAAENQPLSPTDDHTASAEIAKPSTVTADGQIGPLGLLKGPSEVGPLAASPPADGPVLAGPLEFGKGTSPNKAPADGPTQ